MTLTTKFRNVSLVLRSFVDVPNIQLTYGNIKYFNSTIWDDTVTCKMSTDKTSSHYHTINSLRIIMTAAVHFTKLKAVVKQSNLLWHYTATMMCSYKWIALYSAAVAEYTALGPSAMTAPMAWRFSDHFLEKSSIKNWSLNFFLRQS